MRPQCRWRICRRKLDIVKACDQITSIRKGFDTSNHTFLSKIAAAVAEKIKADTGLEVILTGKEVNGDTIKAALIGQSSDPEENGDIEERVRKTMQSLRNPAALTDLLR